VPLDFNTLVLQIERVIDMVAKGYNRSPGSILTEADLQGHLHCRLGRLGALRGSAPTMDPFVLGSYVHSELPWYDENGKLRIRPDITIIEPEHLSILHGYVPPALAPSGHTSSLFAAAPPLPSKQCEFGGKAIILELKFARAGVDNAVVEKVRYDFNKVKRLFRKLDREGEGESVFAFLVIFNKFPQGLDETPLAGFVREHGSGPRHRIMYRAWRSCPAREFRNRRYYRSVDLIVTNPPYLGADSKRVRG
jgi:hypothetical protein